MPDFTGLVNWIQAGISYSYDPSFSQNYGSQSVPQDDDVIMSSIPSSDAPDDAWNDLKIFALNLLRRDPNSLAPHELALLRVLNRRYEVEEEEKRKQKRPKRSDSLIDEVMMSPPPSHQPLPSESPSTSIDFAPPESPHVNQGESKETAEGTDDFTSFANIRHHPYHRSHARGQHLPGSVPNWVKKKASARTLNSREQRDEQESLGDAARSRDTTCIEAKKAELLAQARLHVEEAGGRWDQGAFLREYGFQVQEAAEYLVREELANASRTVKERCFARAAQYINSLCAQQFAHLAEAEREAQAKVHAVEELDKAIDHLRAELRELRMKRKHYPGKTILDDELRRATASRRNAARQNEELISEFRSILQQHEDVFEAWDVFQARFNLPTNAPPFAAGSATPTCPLSPHEPSATYDSTLSSPFSDPESQPASSPTITSDELPSSPASSSSFDPSPRVPRPFSCRYLPTKRPRSDAERFTRYESDWALLRSNELRDEHASFEQMPWPVLFDVTKDKLDQLSMESIREFILHPSRVVDAKAIRQQELLRWHSDKIVNILPKFSPQDRPAILEASAQVLVCLIDIYKSL
ncbi:hypothetical protein D9756_009370 [Leucocoprinus leucothites]|uniref:Uncharacterized protein n=1 Tax=Leucocoprinus leucothites TaxID=201217 RepID=A0A8H5CWE8_9AGAR|nr:hypothetical protein D9756_009370 [Leucoagaricus leucothites]